MRIFVAGASGVIGIGLVPLLVVAGHHVAGMTRSPENAARLQSLGADRSFAMYTTNPAYEMPSSGLPRTWSLVS
jgi:uncharacterized protein YbjT (DUF2867 family)